LGAAIGVALGTLVGGGAQVAAGVVIGAALRVTHRGGCGRPMGPASRQVAPNATVARGRS